MSNSPSVWRRGASPASVPGATTRWDTHLCCSVDSTTRSAWATAQSNSLRVTPGSRPRRCPSSARSRAHPTRVAAESGEARYREALALAEPRGMRPLVAHCHLGLGKLYARTGKREQAQEHLTTATTMYREMDMRLWLEQVEAGL